MSETTTGPLSRGRTAQQHGQVDCEPPTRGGLADGLILGLVGVVIFGMTLPFTRLAVAELDPFFVSLGRALVATACAVLVLAIWRPPVPPRRDWAAFALFGLCIVIGFPVFATLAMLYAPAAHGGIILAVLPLTTAIASVFVAGERPSLGFWACGIAGCAVVLLFALLEGAGDAGLHWADLLLLAAVAAASLGYAVGGVLTRRHPGWVVISWGLVITAPASALLLMVLGGPVNWSASSDAWWSFAYVALGSQFLGFFAWNTGLARGGVARIGQLQLLQPFVTLAGAAVLLAEQITWLQIGFGGLVVLIVALGRRMAVAGPKR